MDKKAQRKEAIIAEYLTGGISFRKLSRKYGIKHQTIHEWVQSYRGRRTRKIKINHRPARPKKIETPSSDVRNLQKELAKAQLYNQLLNEMIDIAEEQLDVPIRKKFGAKQS